MKKNGILFRVASGLLAAALTLSLTACGGSSSNSDASAAADSADSGATHLRLIYSPSLCAAPMYIAIENGYFEDEGLDIEQVTVDAAHVSEAIGADQVDVGMGLIGKMLQPLENGLPIKFTTGLHTGDVERLNEILQRLADAGNSLVIIEHNLDVIKCADFLLDLGPEGGSGGGTLVTCGTPEEVAACEQSYTGQYLRKMLR